VGRNRGPRRRQSTLLRLLVRLLEPAGARSGSTASRSHSSRSPSCAPASRSCRRKPSCSPTACARTWPTTTPRARRPRCAPRRRPPICGTRSAPFPRASRRAWESAASPSPAGRSSA
jgi:hypothetical protein